MKRQIIKIDEEKCTGCGDCVPNCPEGALQIIDGKARLVGELLCDGLGACIGNCPEGAITIEEREAEKYDEVKVMENVIKGGPGVIAAHLKHLKEHNQHDYLKQAVDFLKARGEEVPELAEKKQPQTCACPGTMMRDFRSDVTEQDTPQTSVEGPLKSELRQWPIQLQLLNPNAPYFQNADLVVAADCVPFSYADFHKRFLKGHALVIFCPKLDRVMDQYLEKLAEIFRANDIRSVSIIHMEVPCCFGTVQLVQEAMKRSGKDILIKSVNISLQGEVIS